EWEVQGVPLGAEQIALTDPSFVSRVHALVGEHPEKKIAITCLSGKRSENAIELLQRNGFTNLLSVRRGLHGWLESGLPLKRS
ncbi:MAG: rhodanese-like domain-containing protein, partial [Pseudomonadota bacterium]